MFEREIQFIYDFNQNKVKKLGSFITYEQLEDSEIHPAILQYISGEIDFLIFEDRQKLLKESLFDYSGEQISEHFAEISEIIKRTKRFSLNYIEKLILHASSFTINYLARPKWSILKFIFDEEKTKSALEIKQIFNYFYYYPYLRKIVLSYLDKKKVLSISFEEFKSLLEKIDSISLEGNHNKVINEALDSMAEFVNIGLSRRKLIPLEAVQYFLAEKSLDPFLAKLEKDFSNPDITRYEMSDLKNSLNEVVFEVDNRDVPADEKIEMEDESKPESVDTFGSDNIEVEESSDTEEPVSIPESDEKVLLDGVPLDKPPVPEIEPEDQVLDSVQYPESELDEIDLAEDTRGDGEALEDISEVVKEEIEEREISHLGMDDDEYEPQSERLEEDDEEVLTFENAAPLEDNVEEDVDAAKALYLDEVVAEDQKELVETVEPVEAEPDSGQPVDEEDEELVNDYPEELPEEKDEVNPEEDNEEESDIIVDDESTLKEGSSIDDEVTIDALLDDVEGILENDQDVDELIDEEPDEVDKSGLTEFVEDTEESTEDKDDETAESAERLSDEVLEEDSSVLPPEESIYKSEEDDEYVQDQVAEDEVETGDTVESESMKDEDEDEDEDEDLKLFGDNDFEENETEEKEDEISDDIPREAVTRTQIDVGELLENKKMSKIIDAVFDYDMEDFANAIEKIAESENEDHALKIVDEICSTAQVSPTSKEAKLFKSIISEYFEQN